MTNGAVVGIAGLSAGITFLVMVGVNLFGAGRDLVGAFHVSPFVTILGMGILLLKPMAIAVGVGIVVFLVLGLFQLVSPRASKDQK
jgi:hypothetical protein